MVETMPEYELVAVNTATQVTVQTETLKVLHELQTQLQNLTQEVKTEEKAAERGSSKKIL